MGFKDKVVVPTAGANGIGATAKEAFEKEGAKVETYIRPKLHGLDVDTRDPRDDPIGAVHHDQGEYVLAFGDWGLRGRKRRAARVAALRAVFQAFAGSDAVVPAPVELPASAAPRAPLVPPALPDGIGFRRPRPSISLRFLSLDKRAYREAEFAVRASLCVNGMHEKPFPGRWEAPKRKGDR